MVFLIVRSLVWITLRILFSLYGGIRFEGRENVPRRGGVVIASNHISNADPLTVGFALPRFCYGMAKEELFEGRVLGTLIRWLHGFPVKRNSADRAALRTAERLLARGEAVVIFPEGKESETGEMEEFLPGALLIAQRSKVPILPTILIGTDRLMPYGETRLHHTGKPIVVRFGAPVSVETLTGGAKGGNALRQGASRLREIMLALQRGEELTLPPLPAKAAREPAAAPPDSVTEETPARMEP